MKTILVTGIGGLTPRSLAGIIRENHPDYKIIGCDIEKKAVGFFMEGLLDEYFICPRCNTLEYFPWIEKLVKENLKAAGVKMNTRILITLLYNLRVKLLSGETIMRRMVDFHVPCLWGVNCFLFR